MVNPDFSILKEWMFGKLNFLLKDLNHNPEYEVLKMSLGEPSLNVPEFVKYELEKNSDGWGKYPPTSAIPKLGSSILGYLERRYPGSQNIVNIDKNIVPVPGTREPLHLVGLLAKNHKKGNTKALVTNPFYHAWRAGSISSGSDIHWLNASADNNYLPNIDDIPLEILSDTVIMYICSPSNPHGSVASLDYLKKSILLARKYNFILAIDECYSDIYRLNKPRPLGGLDAALSLDEGLSNLIIFNSLSKRSNVSGMRAGFIVGDEEIIDQYKLLVSNGASPVPIPIQNAAASLYDDEEHHINSCEHYDKNFKIVDKYLNPFFPNFKIPEAGFFLWLPVKNDEKATQILWNKFSLRVMPGSYMAKEINGTNPGKGYLRVSIVDDQEIIEEVMKRICLFLKLNN